MSINKQFTNRLKIKESGNELIIHKKWFDAKKGLFCGAGIIYFILTFKLFISFNVINEDYYFLLVFYLFSASLLSYLILASWMNGNRIIIDQDILEIEQWPIPFIDNSIISSSEIAYIYIRNNKIKGSGKPQMNYEVHALTLGGRDMNLIDGLNNVNQAGRIKKNISDFLKLSDIPSSGHIVSVCQ